MSAAALLWTWFDEPYAQVELRRYRRLFRRPIAPLCIVAGLLLTPLVLGQVFATIGGVGGPSLIAEETWPVAAFLATMGVGLMLIGYVRAHQIWQSERDGNSLAQLLLTGQRPAGIIFSSWGSSVYLCLCLGIAPALVGTIVAVGRRAEWWQWPAGLLLALCCVMAGAAIGAAATFLSRPLTPKWLLRTGAASLGALWLLIWIRVETVADGWHGPWEDHFNHVLQASYLASPLPYLLGIGAPQWWSATAERSLGINTPAIAAAGVYAVFLLALMIAFLALATRGLSYMRANPDVLLTERPAETLDEGQELYWRGFSNPVWTRDLRTRLRSKETAQSIYIVSIAVAAGGFLPLLTTAADLSNPLLTADVAREVFTWLTMTLIALVTLIGPGMTAETIGKERQRGSLDLLLCTPLRPREIMVGKLLGSLSVLALFISPSLPLFGLCVMFHGAEAKQVVMVYIVLLLTLVITGLIGITASAIHSRTSYAKWQAYGLSLLAVCLPGGLGWLAYTIAGPASVPNPEMPMMAWSALQLFFIGFVLLLLWGNAAEQLEYVEY